MRTFITPYKMGSESARDLARSLGVLQIKGEKRLRTCVVINWGRSDLTLRGYVKKIINTPQAVAIAADKLRTFQVLQQAGVPTVEWTTNRTTASSWLETGEMVYCRLNTASSQGRGIVVVGQDDLSMPNAPLYTKGFNKTHEYRVHVAFGEVIDYSKKRKRNEGEADAYVKNFSNGWVFCRDGIALPEKVKSACVKAVAALGLDFAALDILYKERDDVARILELNTAPGVEGTTLVKYTEAFQKYINRYYPPVPTRVAVPNRRFYRDFR